MYQLYFTPSGAPWSKKQLVWQSDMATNPPKYGIYDMKCSVEINKAGELSFVMTQSCEAYDWFAKERSVLTLLMDGSKTIFRGVVKLIETDLFFQRTITANSDLIYLSDSVFEPHGDDIEETPTARFKRILDHHNVLMEGDPEKQIQVGNFTFTNGANKIEKYAKNGGYKDTMSQIEEDFKDFYGFYNIRYNDDYSQKFLDYTETTGKSTPKDIKFAVNIEDYQFDDTVDDLFTILIPCGGDNLTLSGQDSFTTVQIRKPDQTTQDVQLQVADKYIKIVEGIQKFGYIYLAESFTVDSNNVGTSGINRKISNSWSGVKRQKQGGGGGDGVVWTYHILTSGANPSALGLYYYQGGEYHKATETTPVAGRYYYSQTKVEKRENSQGGDSGKDKDYDYVRVNPQEGDNPKAKGWFIRRAFSFGNYIETTDTEVVSGRTYWKQVPKN